MCVGEGVVGKVSGRDGMVGEWVGSWKSVWGGEVGGGGRVPAVCPSLPATIGPFFGGDVVTMMTKLERCWVVCVGACMRACVHACV